jgi:general stress protein 26
MSIDMNDRAAVERKLWEDIERHQTGMLGLAGDTALQPMTAFVERDGERLWFFTRANTELASQIGQRRAGLFVFQQREVQACITGELALQHDVARIAKYWNAVVAAWYPQGKDDPQLTLISMDCRDAEVWCSQAGPVTFAWEIAMANARKHEPHLGGRANLHFH